MNRIGVTKGGLTWSALLPLLVLAFVGLAVPSSLRAQVTATLSGVVEDQSGGVIPGAQVTLTNEATKFSTVVQTNGVGLYAFPSLVPGTYDIKAGAKGFKTKVVTGIVLNAGDSKTVPAFALEVGAESQTVTVSATSEMIPIDSGAKVNVLSTADINNFALEGRDTTELIKVLPGATTVSGGLTNTSPMFSDLDVHVQQSSVGMGMNISGAIYRSGTALLSDGANIIDVGDMGQSLSIVHPEMTAEVSVQSSNFGADTPFGPVVISTISKSGSANYHGQAYFNARNSALWANDWQSNHQGIPLGPQHYYYPGGSFGGPVPGTHKHLMFWGGYERWLQNQGNANVLKSYIPTPAMMSGDFTMTGAGNAALCPKGFFSSNGPNGGSPPSGGYPSGSWCSDLGGTVFANGATTASAPASTETGTYTVGSTTYYTTAGQKFPAGFLDPGSAALAKIWPAANADPSKTPGGYNYYQPIPNIDNGWIYRFRIDYQLGDNTKIYGSYQQAYDADLASGNGAHLYWTPGNAIPFPGGGEQQVFKGKSMAGHVVHNFSSTTTNDFMAAWAFGSFPFTEPNPSAAYRTTLGYPYGTVFHTNPALNIPAYSSAGTATFPDFSQASIFENPPGQYGVRKEAPQFADTLTKVWGAHTIKLGGFTQTTDNWQSTFSSYLDGNLGFGAGQNPDYYNAGHPVIGSKYNAVANFVMGNASSYSENDSAPIADLAYMSTAAFVQDHWKTTRHLSLDLGIRMEHVGHWYDRNRVGMPVFYPGRVLNDFYTGKYAPGFYWHQIDAGVPLSGQPNRFVYPDARFGMSYDVFGTGNTVVRGGWGVYRFITQTNTPGGALPTAQHVLGYNLPGGNRIQLQNIGNLAYVKCPPFAAGKNNCGIQGGQTGLDPTDPGQPLTYAYNLTIDQRLPWNSLLEVAYVGNQTSQLSDDAEDIAGSNYSELANQNKTPIGAFFKPDPVTGVQATNPENVQKNPNFATMTYTATGNQNLDYHPFGPVYGTAGVFMMQNTAYANYNGLQVSWTKTTGRLTFNLNGTWSKALGTSLQENPYVVSANYGPMNIDRPYVFNSSYTYNSGTLHTGSNLLNQTLGGWIISGLSTWQAGGYVPAFLGNGVPNFGLGLSYTGLPADTIGASCAGSGGCNLATDTGVTNGLGAGTYFGTDEGLPIMPTLTCNPTSGLGHYQILNGKCFTAPPPASTALTVAKNGGQNYPYMKSQAYFDNDLAISRTFHIYEKQQVQIRASAIDWLNHPLTQFSNLTPLTLNYHVDYNSHAITPNYNQGTTGSNAFGVQDTKSGPGYQRIIELDVKYSF
jgi:hypothetical protein